MRSFTIENGNRHEKISFTKGKKTILKERAEMKQNKKRKKKEEKEKQTPLFFWVSTFTNLLF